MRFGTFCPKPSMYSLVKYWFPIHMSSYSYSIVCFHSLVNVYMLYIFIIVFHYLTFFWTDFLWLSHRQIVKLYSVSYMYWFQFHVDIDHCTMVLVCRGLLFFNIMPASDWVVLVLCSLLSHPWHPIIVSYYSPTFKSWNMYIPIM